MPAGRPRSSYSRPSGIYAIFNLQNNRVYVGCSSDIIFRIAVHLSCLRQRHHIISAWQKDWNRGHVFQFAVLEEFLTEISSSERSNRERFWVNQFSSPYNKVLVARKSRKRIPMIKKISAQAALTPVQVRWARKMHADRYSQVYIAKELGVSQATISNLLTGKNYRKVA